VTFLFTDIEGSTKRWERYGDAMQVAMRRHDAILRDAIETNDGLVFKTIGDAFCAIFTRADAALAAALAAQRSLSNEDFSDVDGILVRMALHTGTADERDDDYFGPAVNRVARLLAIGHGGQVLVSGAASEMLREQLPGDVALRDMGVHHLKDLIEPEPVHQAIAPDLRSDFPPLLSLDAQPNNLPRQLTSFVGRDAELNEVCGLLREQRLVTLLGPGGIGKTRLAVHVGTALLKRFRDGVWLAEFAAIADGALVPNIVAAAAGVQESPNQPMIETLVGFLKNKEALLILDNCEHVIAEAATATDAIVHGCPRVSIVATSRESLRVDGEREYRLSPLPTARQAEAVTAESAIAYGSVALFVDRAKAANPRFELTDENASTVAAICRRLDGIALAIELAAARVKVLSVRAIAERLAERFRILTGGSRNALPRQQTLRALIDWSYDLLDERERNVFRKLAVFAGDFSLASAAAVCAGGSCEDGENDADTLDIIASLIDKSLLQADDAAGETRYHLLESMRDYARAKLDECGESEAALLAHATAYAELAERVEAAWDALSDRQWNALAEPELENWRAALDWTLGRNGNVELGQRLAAALSPVWSSIAPAEGRRWIGTALSAADGSTPSQNIARLEISNAHLALLGMQYNAALSAAGRALRLSSELQDAHGIATAQLFAGGASVLRGEPAEATALLQSALDQFRSSGARRPVAAALLYQAWSQSIAGDADGSRRLFGEALEVFRAIGATRPAAQVAHVLAEAEFQAGDVAVAIRFANEALATARAESDQDSVILDLCNLSAYLVKIGEWELAASHAREALGLARERDFVVAVTYALQHLAAVGALRPPEPGGEPLESRRRAARLLGFVDARFDRLEIRREFTEQQEYDRVIAALDRELGSTKSAELLSQGGALTEASAFVEAMGV
jgi:predicted ATPase/class 3 adenylate cyclase